MAYIKFKPIAPTYSFLSTMQKDALPQYVLDYISLKEEILEVYKTHRDTAAFTNKRLIMFDRGSLRKDIYCIPYKSITNCSIAFYFNYVEMMIYLESGLYFKVKFRNQDDNGKRRIRQIYTDIADSITF